MKKQENMTHNEYKYQTILNQQKSDREFTERNIRSYYNSTPYFQKLSGDMDDIEEI